MKLQEDLKQFYQELIINNLLFTLERYDWDYGFIDTLT